MRDRRRINRVLEQWHQAAHWPRCAGVVGVLTVVALGWAVARPNGPTFHATSAARVWAWERVYTVAEVEHQLVQAQPGWVGRIVLVRARAAMARTWCPPDSIITRLALIDPGRSGGTVPLDLQWGPPDPVLASLRRLPVVGHWAPPPQRPQDGTTTIYRVQLMGFSRNPCGRAAGDLLDADPDYP